MTAPNRIGSEFLVNTTTDSGQFSPALAGLAGGGFVAVWTDTSETGGDLQAEAVRAQIFAADGSPVGGEFLVNSTTVSAQSAPAATRLADGRFCVLWQDFSFTGDDTSGWSVRGQLFAANGAKDGGEFLVNTSVANGQSAADLAALQTGGFVTVWQDESESGGDTSSAAVRGQVFGADDAPAGGEFLVNTITASHQVRPAIATLSDGRFVVSWTDFSETGGDTSVSAVRAQMFDADGSKSGGEILVNTTTTNYQDYTSLAALAGGRFVVTWADHSETGGDTSQFAVRGQVFNADGSAAGGEFLVNTTATGSQSFPAVTALSDGRFVVAWTDESATGGDTSGAAVRGQVFNASGAPAGEEFVINSTILGSQRDPALAALDDGRFVVAWQDSGETGGDTSSDAVRGQIFDAGNVPYTGTAGDDTITGTTGANTIDGLAGADRLDGRKGDDQIDGGGGKDVLLGRGGADRLAGGGGADRLTGGKGGDSFVFLAGEHGKNAQRDVITDFRNADVIDLTDIDARKGAGNQAFRFIGDDDFHGRKGELRFEIAGRTTLIQADTDGDGRADFEIDLSGRHLLEADDFLL